MSVEKWSRGMSTKFKEKEIPIAHKHVKGHSTSFKTRKMQIKRTQKDHFSPIRLAKGQKSDAACVGKAAGPEAVRRPAGGSENRHAPMEGGLTVLLRVTAAHTL